MLSSADRHHKQLIAQGNPPFLKSAFTIKGFSLTREFKLSKEQIGGGHQVRIRVRGSWGACLSFSWRSRAARS